MKKKKASKKSAKKKVVKKSVKKKVVKKKPVKKIVKKVKKSVKKSIKKAIKKAVPKRKLIGEVTHFYDKICVAVVRFDQGVAVGDEICFEGPKESFSQVLNSMQYEHQPIQKTTKRQEVGVKVKKPVKEGHKVYKA